MYARNRQADQKIDVLFLTCAETFSLAPDYFVISESKSILGGLFSSSVIKFKSRDASISTTEIEFVSEFFSLLAYQQIALAEGIAVPPDPSFPSSTAVRVNNDESHLDGAINACGCSCQCSGALCGQVGALCSQGVNHGIKNGEPCSQAQGTINGMSHGLVKLSGCSGTYHA